MSPRRNRVRKYYPTQVGYSPRFGNAVARYASNMAGNALSSFVPGGPLAKALATRALRYGAQKGYAYFSKRRRSAHATAPIAKLSKAHVKWKGTSTGASAGKFRRPKKLKTSHEKKALQNGSAGTVELWGRVEDGHCCYLTHSTYNSLGMAQTIGEALLRKLFASAGLKPSSKDAEVNVTSSVDARGGRVVYYLQDPTNSVISNTSHTFNDNDSIALIVAEPALAMLTHLDDCLTGQTTLIPYRLMLQFQDFTGGGAFEWRTQSDMLLTNYKIDIQVSSRITVQNRSAGVNADAGSLYDLDRLDNQPLSGRLYEFRNSDPRLSAPKTLAPAPDEHTIGTIRSYGHTLERGAVIDLEEPPLSIKWNNCIKSSNVNLEPGAMRTDYLSHRYTLNFISFLKKYMGIRASGTRGSYVCSGVPGKSRMLILEEKLRTDAQNPITVQYERQVKYSCWFTSTKSSPWKSSLEATEITNVPPPPPP